MKSELGDFLRQNEKFKKYKMSLMLDKLSEVISINPTYHDDKPLADILFIEMFN